MREHSDTAYPEGSRVLEAGCGVGAQSTTLARNSPGARIVSVDISAESLAAAKAKVEAAGLTNVRFQQADVYALPFERELQLSKMLDLPVDAHELLPVRRPHVRHVLDDAEDGIAFLKFGSREGRIADPFGNVWTIATLKERVSPEEMQRRLTAAGY